MKTFEVPVIEIVRFSKEDTIATSSCLCVDCTVCPPGKNDCMCYDFGGGYTNEL